MTDRSKKLVGTVVKILGKTVSVRASTRYGERVFECHLRGRLFDAQASGHRSQVAVGDDVELLPVMPLEMTTGDHSSTLPEMGVIHEVLERRSALVRQTGSRNRQPTIQVLAANLDQVVVVSAVMRPSLKPGLIDRYLVIAHDAHIAPALCLNKIDAGSGDELAEAKNSLELYRTLGYPVIYTSAKTGTGIDALRLLLADKRSVLTGHSGVGKSKLAAALQPGLELSSGEVDKRGKGRHTTSAATLFPLEGGGELVDTPGVRELSIQHLARAKLAHGFIEFREPMKHCHFATCSHIHEPNCGVQHAFEHGAIEKRRYESYQHLYEELT